MASLSICGPQGRLRSRFYSVARDLRGPGLRAYFLCEQKVGKKSLKPAV